MNTFEPEGAEEWVVGNTATESSERRAQRAIDIFRVMIHEVLDSSEPFEPREVIKGMMKQLIDDATEGHEPVIFRG